MLTGRLVALARSWSARSCALRKRKQYVNLVGSVDKNWEVKEPIRCLPYGFQTHTPVCRVTQGTAPVGTYTYDWVHWHLWCLCCPYFRTRRIVLGYDATDPYYLLDRDIRPFITYLVKIKASNEDHIILDTPYSYSCKRVIQYFLEGTLTRRLCNLTAPHGIGVLY
jgi:hypothetical protein